jgi:t-SNARE complex subunit (syntaxin)
MSRIAEQNRQAQEKHLAEKQKAEAKAKEAREAKRAKAEAELRAETRRAYLTNPAASESDFEKAWASGLREKVFEQAAVDARETAKRANRNFYRKTF